MEFSAQQIATILNGKVEGDESVTVNGLSKIEEGKPHTLTFLANTKYEPHIYNTEASIAIVASTFSPSKLLPKTLTLVKVKNPQGAFAQLLKMYDEMRQKPAEIAKTAVIAETATIGKNVYLGAHVVIGENVTIADGVQIYPNTFIDDNVSIDEATKIYANVSIYHDCVIGKNCTIHSGAVIGSDGFGFAPNEKGEFQPIPQIGNVILEDRVDVGANSTIDRATLGSTILRKGVKVDNLVQIAHNVVVDENSAFAAQAGIAGSTKIGKHVLVGGQVGISGHIKIADRTQIAAQSGIGQSVKEKGTTVMGSPAIPIGDFKRSYVGFRSLPSIMKRLRKIERNK